MNYLEDNILLLSISIILLFIIAIRKRNEIISPGIFIPFFIFLYIIIGNINLIFCQNMIGWFSEINPKKGNTYALIGFIILTTTLIFSKKNTENLKIIKLLRKIKLDKYLIYCSFISIIINSINYAKLGGLIILQGGLSGYERFSLRDQLVIPKGLQFASFLIAPLFIRIWVYKSNRIFFVLFLLAQILFAFGLGDRHLIFIPLLTASIFLFYSNKISKKNMIVFILLTPLFLVISSLFRGDGNSVALQSIDSYFGSEYRDYLRLTNEKFKFENGSTIASVFFNSIPKQFFELFDSNKENFSIYSAYILMDLWGNETGQRAGICGEFYLNFGFYGMLVCFFIYGLLLKWLDRNLIVSNNLTRKKLLLSYVFSLFFFSIFASWATIGDDIGTVVVRVDPEYYRPTEVDLLIGDPTKSKTQLGWKPQYDLAAMVKEMVASDLKLY